MNPSSQRALRDGRSNHLRVDGHDCPFNVVDDERERANQAPLEPEGLAALRRQREDWQATMPAIPDDATIGLGYGDRDVPQRRALSTEHH